MRSLRSLGCWVGAALLLIAAGTGETRGEGPASREAIRSPLFADENLLAWCIVPYDQRERSPAERIALLRELGLRQYVWDWRERHLSTLNQEIEAAREGGVKLRGVWLWIDERNDRIGALGPANTKVVQTVAAAGLSLEWWVGFHANVFSQATDGERIAKGAAWATYLRDLAAPSQGTIVLYNHGDWFGEPENQIRIIAAAGKERLGMVYNFHHAHAQIDRFGDLLPKMLPHLRAVVINGMRPEGPKILPVGSGSHERRMLRVLADSGYRGPIGILGHVEDADVGEVLRRNRDGLHAIAAGR